MLIMRQRVRNICTHFQWVVELTLQNKHVYSCFALIRCAFFLLPLWLNLLNINDKYYNSEFSLALHLKFRLIFVLWRFCLKMRKKSPTIRIENYILRRNDIVVLLYYYFLLKQQNYCLVCFSPQLCIKSLSVGWSFVVLYETTVSSFFSFDSQSACLKTITSQLLLLLCFIFNYTKRFGRTFLRLPKLLGMTNVRQFNSRFE